MGKRHAEREKCFLSNSCCSLVIFFQISQLTSDISVANLFEVGNMEATTLLLMSAPINHCYDCVQNGTCAWVTQNEGYTTSCFSLPLPDESFFNVSLSTTWSTSVRKGLSAKRVESGSLQERFYHAIYLSIRKSYLISITFAKNGFVS